MAPRRRTKYTPAYPNAVTNDGRHDPKPSGGGGGGGGGPAAYPNAKFGSSHTPPSRTPNVSTVQSGGSGPRTVIRAGGDPVRPDRAPTLREDAASPSRYVTTADALRARYLGGSAGAALQQSVAEQLRQAVAQSFDPALRTVYGRNSEDTLTDEQIASLAEAEGMTGIN